MGLAVDWSVVTVVTRADATEGWTDPDSVLMFCMSNTRHDPAQSDRIAFGL